ELGGKCAQGGAQEQRKMISAAGAGIVSRDERSPLGCEIEAMLAGAMSPEMLALCPGRSRARILGRRPGKHGAQLIGLRSRATEVIHGTRLRVDRQAAQAL